MKPFMLGTDDAGVAVFLNVESLVASRMLVQANSGGGKSWAIRRIVEHVGAMIPIIMFDPEGEFFTLREKLDVVLVRHGGDLTPRLESAGPLATQLLEARVSAVIDLLEFNKGERREYVRRFLETMLAAPKRLWEPAMVVLDEAHDFAPEADKSAALEGVLDLMTKGRKRTYCGVLATQRLSKLHKDAAAEANNVMVGRCVLDVDQGRAAQTLGISKHDAVKLRDLDAGTFKAFGPAFDRRGVFCLTVGTVATSHGREKLKAATIQAPSVVLKNKLAALEELGKPDPNRIDDLDAARKRIADLEAAARVHSAPDPDEAKRQYRAGYADGINSGNAGVLQCLQETKQSLEVIREKTGTAIGWIDEYIRSIPSNDGELFAALRVAIPQFPAGLVRDAVPGAGAGQARNDHGGVSGRPAVHHKPVVRAEGDPLSRVERAFLKVLAQRGAMARIPLHLHAGYAASGDTSKAIAKMLRDGWMDSHSNGLSITQAGLKALGPFETLPAGKDLRALTLAELDKCESRLLAALFDVYPTALTRKMLHHRAGYAQSGDTSKAIARLIRRGFIDRRSTGELVASGEFFK